MLVAADKVYYFGDSTRVVCRQGFRAVGPDSVTCMANQTFSAMPVCEDINECADGSADCIPGSTKCVNLPGGYRCDCLPGYQAQLGSHMSIHCLHTRILLLILIRLEYLPPKQTSSLSYL